MKKPKLEDDLRPEYKPSDFKGGGVRGKYHQRVMEKSNVVVIDPDVSKAFPNAATVNEALRSMLRSRRARRAATGRSGRKRAAA
jgi:hypothetical protein